MATVTFQHASRTYPGTDAPAVDALDLEIRDGEFLVLVGPSGCGKSTTLRMLAGLEPVDDGHILIGDREVTDVAPKNRDIAMVFQSYALYPHMTVADNIGFHLRVKKMNTKERRTRIEEAAHILDLEDLLDRKPAKLSGGQRSGSPSDARSFVSQRRSSWTNRCRTSTRNSASRPAPRSRLAARTRCHHGVRHPRPDRGDDDGRSRRR